MITTNRPDMSWRLWSPAFKERLQDLLQEIAFDVVQIEGIEMASYLPIIREFAPQAKVIYDDHNAEWLLQYRNFTTDLQNPSRWIAAVYSFIQTQRLKKYERWVCQQADGVVAVSEADREAILQLDSNLKIVLVPNGVDLASHDRRLASEIVPVDLVFTGKMDYRPNIDAMLWFGQQVFPLILKKRPKTTLAIVGQRPHPRLNPLKENPAITITGYVNNILPYIAGTGVYIAPFRVGGGTRLKLLQAMAMRKAIVATTVGAEGFPVTSNQEMILVDDPDEMAQSILELLDNPRRRHELGRKAHQFVVAHYTWEALIPAMEKLYE